MIFELSQVTYSSWHLILEKILVLEYCLVAKFLNVDSITNSHGTVYIEIVAVG